MRMQPRVREQCEDRERCGMEQIQSMQNSGNMQEVRDMRNMNERWYMTGILPENAPLANPFVPFQRNNPPTYPAQQGVVRGTLFPGLDLPYRGMVNNGTLSETHLHELQSLAFALTELGEYLDTHADDMEAFALFRSYAELYQKGREKYEKMHGPLTQKGSANNDRYSWLNDPWPWEFAANEERD